MRKTLRHGILTLIVGAVLLAVWSGVANAQAARQNERPSTPASPSLTPRQAAPDSHVEKKSSGLSPILVVGSLAFVLGVFFLGMWLFRRAAPTGFGVLPTEAFELLGRARLNARQQVHLLRCGDKVLLVAVGMASAATLTEITDPTEVERLVELCRRPRSGGAAAVLRQALRGGEGRSDG